MYGLGGLIGMKAPEFPKDSIWLNTTSPLSLAKLKGHVVVIDFWTYCCINCMHMLPVLEQLEEEYKDEPVIVLGVHSAKFTNEQKVENIEEAIARYEIRHPVVVDEDMRVWNSFGASAWPTFVVVDPKGNLVYRSAGEKSLIELSGVVEMLLEKYKKDPALAKEKFKIKAPDHQAGGILSFPGKISFSDDKTKFAVSDSNHNRILIVETQSGKVLDKVGTGKRGKRIGGYGESEFYRPQGVFWKGDSIYVADTENHTVRVINTKSRDVDILAGTGEQGRFYQFGYSGEGKKTAISSPWDLAVYNDILYIAMAGFHQIWSCELKSGFIFPFAGDGAENIYDGTLQSAELAQPSGIFVDGDFMYVADSEVSGVRSINMKSRYISTLAGSGLFEFGLKDGSLTEARLQHPLGVCANGDSIYVADTYNSSIRMIDLKKQAITTIVGTPKSKSMCKFGDPNCDTLGLYEPSDVKYLDDKLYIADTNNHLIRIFDLRTQMLGTLKLEG